MSLTSLQQVLQSQVDAAKAVTVTAATLTQAGLAPRPGLDALVRGHLAIGDADLAIGYTARVPDPAGDTLTLAGPATLLGVAAATVTVTFIVPGDGPADVRVAVELPDGWTLGTAFAALATAPFTGVFLTDIRYVLTTLPTDSYTWNGAVQTLVQGSQLLSIVSLRGSLAIAAGLLSGGSTADTAPLTGVVDPSKLAQADAGLPAVALAAPLGHAVAVPQFSLSAPRVELATGTGDESGTIAWLAFATTLSVEGSPLCDFKAIVAASATSATSITFALAPLDPPSTRQLTPDTMISLLGVDYTTSIPPLLHDIFGAVALKGLTATVSVGQSVQLTSVGALIGSTGPFGYGQFQIEETTLQLLAMAPLGQGAMLVSFDARASIFPDIFDGEFEVEVSYEITSGDLTVAAAFTGEVALSDVLSGLSGGSLSPPGDLEMSFSDFGVTLHKPSGGSAAYTLYGTAAAGVTLPFLGVHVDAELQLLVDSAAQHFQLVGGLMLGDYAFTVTVDLTATDKTITGTWQALSKDGYLGLNKLAQAIGSTAPPIPDGLDLDLESATLSYNVTKSILVLEAQSASYGKAVLVALKSTTWSFFFGLEIDREIGLSDLPIIGPEIEKAISVSVDQIQVLASSTLDATAAGLIDAELARLGGGYPQVPTAGMSGVALAMVFDAGGEKTTLTIATPPTAPALAAGRAGPAALAADPAGAPGPTVRTAVPASFPAHGAAVAGAGDSPPGPPPSPDDGTVWLTLQKSFGPVAFQKVGIRYRDSVLYFLMNASVSGGGLTIAVMGLGVGSPLTSFKPKFTIDGLAITYAEGPVQLSGALVGSIDPVNFYGELILGVEQLQIAALGGYTEVDGHPSFLLYAVLDYPIGGPAFFFVTGLAAGFGFNRKLVIPPVDKVTTFPLVQWAQGAGNPPPMDTTSIADTVTKVVGELSSSGVVAPSVGDYWLAIGVRFTSFELVESFALLTVEFGNQFEIALLGVSTVQLPPAPASAVALAQLELKAVFIPSEGLLAVSGQLTPQSFVLSPDCHLTGGFSLTTWFAGEHEGEFVLTLGGYSPRFSPPPYYPVVPRLGLNWQVTSELAIKGDLYFALTSSAVMAGGGLSAVWQSGSIRAWFDVEADFLLVFEPFHYYLGAGIHLGCSFTVNLLFTSFTISIHLGVSLEIWGPEFAGRATIDLSIISFTISFGGGSPDTKTTIGWGDFLAKLMPSGAAPSARPARLGRGRPAALRRLAAAAAALGGPGAAGQEAADLAADPSPHAIVQIIVQGGLLKRLSDTEGELNWVVSGEQLQLVTQSAIPTKQWSFSDNVTLVADAPAPNTDFGVGPVGVGSTDLTSTHTIEITSNEACAFLADPVLRNVPTALWQTRAFDSHGVPVGVDPVNSTTVDGVSTGFTITPHVLPPDHTLPIPIENLDYTIADPVKAFEWSDATGPPTDPFDGQTVWGTIAAAGPAAVRQQLVNEIAAEGWPVPTQIDVSELATLAAYDLVADPVLRLLGEQR
jgi:hypothetical protein